MPRRTDSRSRMIHAAAELFRQRGYHATTFSDVVRDSGAPLDRHNVLRDFRKITAAAGLGTDWVPREMRHTFVSRSAPTGCRSGT